MGWPKGSKRGPQSPEHRARAKAAQSAGMKRSWQDPLIRANRTNGIKRSHALRALGTLAEQQKALIEPPKPPAEPAVKPPRAPFSMMSMQGRDPLRGARLAAIARSSVGRI